MPVTINDLQDVLKGKKRGGIHATFTFSLVIILEVDMCNISSKLHWKFSDFFQENMIFFADSFRSHFSGIPCDSFNLSTPNFLTQVSFGSN